jgi:hypothetical protein
MDTIYYECIVYQQLKQNTFGQKIKKFNSNTLLFFLIDIKIIYDSYKLM